MFVMTLIFFLYQIIQLISFPFFLIYLLIRKLKGKIIVGNFKQRLGFVPKTNTNPNQKVIWFHAVSVGEILSIQNLIKKIKQTNPNFLIYVTTGTKTGKLMAKQHLDADFISFLPFDFLFSIFLLYKRIQPKCLIIVEAEFWPNLLFMSIIKKIPCYLINARITKRSEKKYLKFKIYFKPLINIFSQIYAQSNLDADRFEKIGISKNKLIILGDIKSYNVFEKQKNLISSPDKRLFTNNFQSKITLLAGCIHPQEDIIYLNLFKKLKKNFKNITLILAPRHFTWQETLISNVKASGLSYKTWSLSDEINNETISESESYDVIIILKLGILFQLYPLTKIFFLGGTFIPVGGHNLLEAAAWGIPSFVGPYHQNCIETFKQLHKVKGSDLVQNEIELFNKTNLLLADPQKILEMGNNAKNWLSSEAAHVEFGVNSLIKKLNKL